MGRQSFRDLIRFKRGFILSRPKIDANTDYAAEGSQNVIFTGQGRPRPFKGLELVAGIGGVFGQPVGGIVGFAGAPPNIPSNCLNQPVQSWNGEGWLFENPLGAPLLIFASTQSVMNNAEIRVRFPERGVDSPGGDNGMLVGFGTEDIATVCGDSKNIYSFGTCEGCGVAARDVDSLPLNLAPWTNEEWRLTIENGTVKYYRQDGTLFATSPTDATDVPLFLYVRIVDNSGIQAVITSFRQL